MTDPQRIGRYLVIERLGTGGIGEVFLAQREGDPRLCALKRLLPKRMMQETAQARILREAHVATFLDHPNIASVFWAGEEEGAFCIASEFVPGRDLYRILVKVSARKELLPPRFCFAIAIPVLEALAHAHEVTDPGGARLDLVHRDLSTKNVMVSFAGQVKVIDFGVARAKVDEFRTQAGLLVGSPNYVSPEQAVGDPIDRRADLYSVSAVLFEMLTGRRLATGATVAAVLRKVADEEAPLASTLNASLPAELDPILARGLKKPPAERWPDANSYLAALRPIAERTGIATREELGTLIRDLFPEEEEKAAQIVREARARFETIDAEETRAAFWERTVVQPRTEKAPPRRRRRKGWSWSLEIGLAVFALSVLAIVLSQEREAPVTTAAPSPPPPVVVPVATQRSVEETAVAPPAPPPAPPIVRAIRKPPPREVEPPPARSEIERRLDALIARGAGSSDPEMQAFTAELERLAKGDARAEAELKKVGLCLIDRSCGSEQLYRRLSLVARAIGTRKTNIQNTNTNTNQDATHRLAR